MNADGESFQENEHAAPSAERRSEIERRMSCGRRRTDSTGTALDAPAPDLPALTSPNEPESVRKYYFRSFESRRDGTERRACSCDHESKSCQTSPDTENGRLAADEAASLPRQKG
jgi:hypothetical protein